MVSAPILLAVLCSSAVSAQTLDARGVGQARDAYNAAIARRDLPVMAGALAPTYHLLAGRSAQSHGVEAMQSRWASAFATDSLYGCVRTPLRVQVNREWQFAHETGRWRCTYDGVPKGAKPGSATGVYDAKWQRDTAGTWRLHAEVFTALRCLGGSSACIPPDSIPPSAVRSGPAAAISEAAVRAARAAYNADIVRGDARTIAQRFAPTYHAVFGRGAHIEGDSAALVDWAQEFRDNGVSSCVRTTTQVVVNAAWRIAHERGTWRCRSGRAAADVSSSGVYVAKWQRDVAGQWRVHAEVFTTLHCTGAAAPCTPPEPLPAR